MSDDAKKYAIEQLKWALERAKELGDYQTVAAIAYQIQFAAAG